MSPGQPSAARAGGSLVGGLRHRAAPVDGTQIDSTALAGSPDTPLGRSVVAGTPEGQHSGFRLLPMEPFSYDTRLQQARLAAVSLDLRYYHFEADETGRALRGVRLRLRIDDLYTGGQDDLFMGFAAHPNVELRLFSPFCCARGSGQAGRFADATLWTRLKLWLLRPLVPESLL